MASFHKVIASYFVAHLLKKEPQINQLNWFKNFPSLDAIILYLPTRFKKFEKNRHKKGGSFSIRTSLIEMI